MRRALERLENLFATISGLTLFVIMLLVTIDALGRHFFNNPLSFQFELTQNYLLVIAVMLALAWGVRSGAHIRVTFVCDRLPPRLARAVGTVNMLLAAAVCAGITWMSAGRAWHAWVNTELEMGVIDWPVAYARVWVPLGFGLLTLRMLLDAWQALHKGPPTGPSIPGRTPPEARGTLETDTATRSTR